MIMNTQHVQKRVACVNRLFTFGFGALSTSSSSVFTQNATASKDLTGIKLLRPGSGSVFGTQ